MDTVANNAIIADVMVLPINPPNVVSNANNVSNVWLNPNISTNSD